MNSFEQIATRMRQHAMQLPPEKIMVSLPDARKHLYEALAFFVEYEKQQPVWLPEYDEIADWLAGNQGRGLFLFGNHGRGKSLMCRYVLPALLLKYCHKVVSVFDVQAMNRDIDRALSKHLLSLDDIGTEEVVNNFGNRRLAFAEIMDAAEKQNKLVIVSTNLNLDALRATYGERTLERIKSTTRRVLFSGDSLRK